MIQQDVRVEKIQNNQETFTQQTDKQFYDLS